MSLTECSCRSDRTAAHTACTRSAPNRLPGESGVTRIEQLVGLVGWLALSFAVAAVGAAASAQAATFYQHLAQPSWAPPSSVFGPVWSVLYALMGIAAWLVWREGGFRRHGGVLVLFVIQLALNALWSWLFLVLGELCLGAELRDMASEPANAWLTAVISRGTGRLAVPPVASCLSRPPASDSRFVRAQRGSSTVRAAAQAEDPPARATSVANTRHPDRSF